MPLVEYDSTPLDAMQQALLRLRQLELLLVRLVVVRSAKVVLRRKGLAAGISLSDVQEEGGGNALGGDDNVVFAQLLLRDLASFAVVKVPGKTLRADVVMKLVRPVRSDGQRADCAVEIVTPRSREKGDKRTDQSHVVVSLVGFFRLLDDSLPRVVRHDESDRLHRLAESCEGRTR